MPASLSNLVDNVSEINKDECKTCMERKNIKPECEFTGHKNNNSYFKYKKCEKIWLQPSLLSIANSISEINKKECKTCMERRNIKSEFDFIEIKDKQLSYKYNKCKKKLVETCKRTNQKVSSYISIL